MWFSFPREGGGTWSRFVHSTSDKYLTISCMRFCALRRWYAFYCPREPLVHVRDHL